MTEEKEKGQNSEGLSSAVASNGEVTSAVEGFHANDAVATDTAVTAPVTVHAWSEFLNDSKFILKRLTLLAQTLRY